MFFNGSFVCVNWNMIIWPITKLWKLGNPFIKVIYKLQAHIQPNNYEWNGKKKTINNHNKYLKWLFYTQKLYDNKNKWWGIIARIRYGSQIWSAPMMHSRVCTHNKMFMLEFEYYKRDDPYPSCKFIALHCLLLCCYCCRCCFFFVAMKRNFAEHFN